MTPTFVYLQAGNVNSGAIDSADAAVDAIAGHPNAWLYIDGAFGLWAAVSPQIAAARPQCQARGLLPSLTNAWKRLLLVESDEVPFRSAV